MSSTLSSTCKIKGKNRHMASLGKLTSICIDCGNYGAQGEIRTHTPVKAGDFETLSLIDFKR